MLAGSAVAVFLTSAGLATPVVHDAQVAVLDALPARLGSYFKYYCVAINPGALPSPVTRDSLLLSTHTHRDPPDAVLDGLKQASPRFVAASECDRTGGEWDIIHRATGAKPAILVAVGQVEVVSSRHVRLVVFTTSGFLSDTHTLYDLERSGARWEVVASKILLQT